MPSFKVFKGTKEGKAVESTTTKPDQLEGDQVLLRVTASGICGTDLHYLKNDMVLGHEGVGVVESLGPDCKFLKKGDRVGWGYETDACLHCLECLKGEEIFCPKRAMYGYASPDQGSFAEGAVWREAFLHPIPEGLSDEDAAPLQCGGATVFTALQGARPTDVIGVMGMGGLGHLAIQFANKMGCRVVCLSGTDSKKDEATRLGARDFLAMKDKTADDLKDAPMLDRLLVTTSAQPDWKLILPLMKTRSSIYPLSVSEGDFAIPYMPLLANGITIQGSLVATRSVHREMLEFAALHECKPVIEKFPMTEEGIAEAIGKLESGKIHFRAVLIPQKK